MERSNRVGDERAIARWAVSDDGSLLAVTGQRGIGKTTSVTRALRRASDRMTVVRVGGSTGDRPYAHGLGGAAVAALDRFRRVGAHGDTIRTRVLPDVDLDGFLRATANRVGRSALDRPKMLILDDVDRLDRVTAWEVVETADSARAAGWRVIVIASWVEDGAVPTVRTLTPLAADELRDVLRLALHRDIGGGAARRLAWWSGGNPRLALEIADSLTDAQLFDAEEWTDPPAYLQGASEVLGDAVRRLGADALDTLAGVLHDLETVGAEHDVSIQKNAPGAADLLSAGIVQPSGGALALVQPMAALLVASSESVLAQSDAPAERLPAVQLGSAGGQSAESFALAVMSGTSQAFDVGALAGPLDDEDTPVDWWDVLWSDNLYGVPSLVRSASRRVAGAILGAEQDAAARRAPWTEDDLDALISRTELNPFGGFLLVRVLLASGRVDDARDTVRALRCRFDAEPRLSVTRRVAIMLADAMVSSREGSYRQVRRLVGMIVSEYPASRSWLAVRGLPVVTDALLDGVHPPRTLPDEGYALSPRALGEYAVDLAVAHLVAGRRDVALSLLSVALGQCPSPWQGRSYVAIAAAPALMLDDRREIHRGLERFVRDELTLLEGRRPYTELARALLATLEGLSTVSSLPGAHVLESGLRVPIELQVHGRIALGCSHLLRGDVERAAAVFDHAATLAGLAGMNGWCPRIRAFVPQGAVDPDSPSSWDAIDESHRDIIRCVVRGATNADIAQQVFVSERTVVNRLRDVYRLLGVSGRSELIERAESERPGWLDPDSVSRVS